MLGGFQQGPQCSLNIVHLKETYICKPEVLVLQTLPPIACLLLHPYSLPLAQLSLLHLHLFLLLLVTQGIHTIMHLYLGLTLLILEVLPWTL
jgi:hypothetical protein